MMYSVHAASRTRPTESFQSRDAASRNTTCRFQSGSSKADVTVLSIASSKADVTVLSLYSVQATRDRPSHSRAETLPRATPPAVCSKADLTVLF